MDQRLVLQQILIDDVSVYHHRNALKDNKLCNSNVKRTIGFIQTMMSFVFLLMLAHTTTLH